MKRSMLSLKALIKGMATREDLTDPKILLIFLTYSFFLNTNFPMSFWMIFSFCTGTLRTTFLRSTVHARCTSSCVRVKVDFPTFITKPAASKIYIINMRWYFHYIRTWT